MTAQRDVVIGLAQDLGWPVLAVYADVGQPSSQLTALAEAITAGSAGTSGGHQSSGVK
jgi:hypothetical protein